MLMAFASYNAGSNRIVKLRQQAREQGLDPNKWFDNVELMVARDIGQETVTYVSNVYKYYIAYKLTVDQVAAKEKRNAWGREELTPDFSQWQQILTDLSLVTVPMYPLM
jgi:membrane-bound lytic murein transglycosylase MltF